MVFRHIPVWALLLAAAAASQGGVQSPINLNPKVPTGHYGPLYFSPEYKARNSLYALSNTGHGCQVTLVDPTKNPTVSGGPLPAPFEFKQAHFHWGDDDKQGSEHEIDEHPFSMEVHLVHWNTKYGTYEKAAEQPDGLAVIGFFLEAQANEKYVNKDFDRIVELIPEIKNKKSLEIVVEDDLLKWVVRHLDTYNYYSYKGSLTTKPYSANVFWIVYSKPIAIGRSQIAAFRTIKNEESETLKSNFRRLQNSNGVPVVYVKAPGYLSNFAGAGYNPADIARILEAGKTDEENKGLHQTLVKIAPKIIEAKDAVKTAIGAQTPAWLSQLKQSNYDSYQNLINSPYSNTNQWEELDPVDVVPQQIDPYRMRNQYIPQLPTTNYYREMPNSQVVKPLVYV